MKKVVLFFVFILSLFLIVGCEDSPKDNEEKNKSREVTKDEKEKLVNIIDKMKYLDYYGKSFEVKDLTNQEALRASYNIYTSIYPNGELKFSKIEEVADNYLGFSLEPEHILCDTHFNILGASDYILLYDSKKDEFVDNDSHLGHGGGGFTTAVYNRFVSGTVLEDVYTIKVYKLFSDLTSDVMDETSYYYSSYSNAQKEVNKLFKTTYNFETNRFDKDPQNVLDNMDTDDLIIYTYTFILDDGNYVLDEYKIG